MPIGPYLFIITHRLLLPSARPIGRMLEENGAKGRVSYVLSAVCAVMDGE